MNGNIIVYQDWIEYTEILNDEQAGQVFKAILSLANDREYVCTDPTANMCFTFLKKKILIDADRYEETKIARSEAGKKGAEARWQTMANNGKGMAKNGNRINVIKNGCDLMANDSNNLNSKLYLNNECITAHTRVREDAVISDDDFVTTTDGRQIPLKDLTFPEKIKIGLAQPSDDTTILGHKKLTEEEKERMRKRAEEFASGVRRG